MLTVEALMRANAQVNADESSAVLVDNAQVMLTLVDLVAGKAR